MTVVQELEEVLDRNYRRVGEATGYWGNYFIRDLRTIGGVATVKRLLRPKPSEKIPSGLQMLFDYRLTDLSVEQTALDNRFKALFTKPELQEAKRRLKDFDAYLRRKPETPIEEIIRDPIRREMLIEAFERKASWARLARKLYGYECMAPNCQFSFVKEDGELYIEVHHVKPMFENGSPNDPLNLSVLCASHHRAVHYAKAIQRKKLTDLILEEQTRRLRRTRSKK